MSDRIGIISVFIKMYTIYFTVSNYVYFFVGRGSKSIAKLDGRAMAGLPPLDPPLDAGRYRE